MYKDLTSAVTRKEFLGRGPSLRTSWRKCFESLDDVGELLMIFSKNSGLPGHVYLFADLQFQ